MRRALALLGLVLSGCGACDGEGEPPRDAGPEPSAALIEPWLMGITSGHRDATLPPPCRLTGEALTTVLHRETRLASEPATPGGLLVAEGASRRVGERPAHPALALKRWSADASGWLTMRHGAARSRAMPWSDQRSPEVARAEGDHWLVLADRSGEQGLWRDGRWERIGGAALAGGSLRCRGPRCALLTPPVDAGGQPTGADGATLWIGRGDEPLAAWARHRIDLPGSKPFAVAGLDAEGQAVAAVIDDLRLRFVAVHDGAPEVLATPAAPHGAVAVTLAREPVAVAYAGPAGSRRCDAVAGGVVVSVGNGEGLQLRSAQRADAGAAHAIDGGVLVTWLAPARCDGPRRVLHAVIIKDDGRPTGPVTVVGQAEGYAVATQGNRVDLWIRRPGGVSGPGDMGTVLYLPATCSL